MAARLSSCDGTDEDYIDMEVSSHSNLFFPSMNSPPSPTEFEFQMFSSSYDRDTTTSPADDLFYKGKLLPLHLPPRLQMVEKLLHNSNSYGNKIDNLVEFFSTPLMTTTTTTPTTNTPYESCNISPSESCQVSRELNSDEYFFEYSTEGSNFIGENPNKSWTSRLKQIKQSSLGSKLKASRAYLKALCSKSGCSNEITCAAATTKISKPNARECLNEYAKVTKNTPFGQIQTSRHQISTSVMRSFNKEKIYTDGRGHHRSSFSGGLKRLSTTRSFSSLSSSGSSSSSSSSTGSNGFQEFQFLKRSSSSNSEADKSIQAAIAHCKSSLSSSFIQERI